MKSAEKITEETKFRAANFINTSVRASLGRDHKKYFEKIET